MRVFRSVLAVSAACGLALAGASPAAAAAIQLYNTGVNNGGIVQPAGSAEQHYVLNGGAGGPAILYQNPAWVTATDAYWIAPLQGGAYTGNPNTYTLTFSLAGLDAATAQLSGLFAADDAGTVSLNGGPTIATTGSWGAFTNFAFNSGFVAGTNTLTFTSTDIFGPPTGLIVSGLQGTARELNTAVPEPATWALLILGFGAVGGTMRRRTALRYAFG